jgi:YVTN family beta-propeller protein
MKPLYRVLSIAFLVLLLSAEGACRMSVDRSSSGADVRIGFLIQGREGQTDGARLLLPVVRALEVTLTPAVDPGGSPTVRRVDAAGTETLIEVEFLDLPLGTYSISADAYDASETLVFTQTAEAEITGGADTLTLNLVPVDPTVLPPLTLDELVSGTLLAGAVLSWSVPAGGLLDSAGFAVYLTAGAEVLLFVQDAAGALLNADSSVRTVTTSVSAAPGSVLTIYNSGGGDLPYSFILRTSDTTKEIPKVYVTNQGSATVSVLHGLNGTVLATIAVGTEPAGVGIDPIAKKAYVANYAGGSVSVIDGVTDAVSATIPLDGGDPQMVAVNPSKNKVYIAYEYYGDIVEIIDSVTYALISSYGTSGNYPVGMAVDQAADRVYVNLWGDSSIDVIDGTTNVNAGNYTGTSSDEKCGLAVNPVTGRIYVPDRVSQDLWVFTTAGTSLGTVTVGSAPISVAVNTLTDTVYVANETAGTVSVVNGATNAVTATIPVGAGPTGIAVSENYNRVYTANNSAGTVSIIDGSTNTVVQTVTVGANPFNIAVME